MISRSDILDALIPDLDAGRLYWIKPNKYHSEKTNREAGCPRSSRAGKHYWVIKINGRVYKRGHLIFCIVHGHFPSPCLDHKNGDSLDDRPKNLREATITQNAWNHKKRARRIELPMGVRILRSGRYQARIAVNKKMMHLGTYSSPEEARKVYMKMRKKFYGEFA